MRQPVLVLSVPPDPDLQQPDRSLDRFPARR
jgi:hypothetical protein